MITMITMIAIIAMITMITIDAAEVRPPVPWWALAAAVPPRCAHHTALDAPSARPPASQSRRVSSRVSSRRW